MGIIIKITSEQNRRSVVKFSFMQQVEFFEDGRQILPYGRFGQTSAFDAPRYRAHDGMFVKVGYFKVGIRHSLPSLFSSTLHQVLVVYFLRHGGCHFRFHTFINSLSVIILLQRLERAKRHTSIGFESMQK